MSKLIELFKPVNEALKLKPDKANIDNNVFRLHYRASLAVLLVCAILVGTKEYIGEPIQCLADGKLPDRVINAYCWIHATFTLPNRLVRVGVEVAHPGVASPTEGEEEKHHAYYPWVFVILIFQGMLFYIPHYLWKSWEGGRLKSMMKDLNDPLVEEKSKIDRKALLIRHLSSTFHHQNAYALRFFFCEALNLVNVIGQMYLMDRFLDGEFFRYGPEVLHCSNVDPEDCSNPMSRVFPKVTKCSFHKFGASGTLEKRDALCVLAINVINEKVYVFLWFWFMLLASATGLMMIYRVLVMISSKLRMYLLYSRTRGLNASSIKDVGTISKKAHIGDWFVLNQLSKNIDPTIFNELVLDLAAKFRSKKDLSCS